MVNSRFRRTAGLFVALFVAGSAYAQPQSEPPPLTAEERRAVIFNVRAAIVRNYVFADAAHGMADAIATKARAGGYDAVKGHKTLATRLTADLRLAHTDAHLRIEYDPEEAARVVDTGAQPARDHSAVDRKNNFYFRRLDILPGNIGYLEFTRFPDPGADASKTVRAAMQYLANTDALIIDLRDNRGGSAAMVNEITSYFVEGRAHWSDSYNRVTDQWTQGWIENRAEVTGGLVMRMPVVVLTSSWTFSAAEGLAYALQQGRGARIVGERSAGGAHVLRRVVLGNGYVGYIPYVRSVNLATKTDWEGTGVAPDVPSDAPDALLRAQEIVLRERLAAAPEGDAKRAIEWAINDARAQAHRTHVAADKLQAYAGRFEEYTFSVRDGLLYVVNSSRDKKMNILVPVGESLFKLDAESQAEFVRDAGGKVTKLRLLWNDGWVDELQRAK